jgi:alpha-beta hydrolase superfamily lysophospholipase
MTSLFYNWEGLYAYAILGYAVVATDYAGLGTEGRHAYIDMVSHGTDVINSVPAAHAAVSHLSQKWVAIGHSQGGLSALGVTQLQSTMRVRISLAQWRSPVRVILKRLLRPL